MKDFSIVIPSRITENLSTCLDSIFQMEPTLDPKRILVVDDGVNPRFRKQVPSIRWLDGQKPFVFSRAVNQGIEAAGMDAILMNDDSRLLTPAGFTNLVAARTDDFGLVSAAIRENVGNRHQRSARTMSLRHLIGGPIAFICVLIPWDVFQNVGPFDERFTAYGSEDSDYCIRVQQAGLKTGVFDPTIVAHDGISTFRTMGENGAMLQKGREILKKKWGLR